MANDYDIKEWTHVMGGKVLVLDAPQHGGEVEIHSGRTEFMRACAAGRMAFSPLEALALLEDPEIDIGAVIKIKRCFGSDSRIQRTVAGADGSEPGCGPPTVPLRWLQRRRRVPRVVEQPSPQEQPQRAANKPEQIKLPV